MMIPHMKTQTTRDVKYVYPYCNGKCINKTGNVRITEHTGVLVLPLLP